MTVPEGVTTAHVIGTFVDFSGRADTGTITGTPNVPHVTVDSDPGLAVDAGPVVIEVEGIGGVPVPVSFDIMATDNANVAPSGWNWRMDIRLRHRHETLYIFAPGGTTVDLTKVAGTAPAEGRVTPVLSVGGVYPDLNGNVPAVGLQGPPGPAGRSPSSTMELYVPGWRSSNVGIDDCTASGAIAEVWTSRLLIKAGKAFNTIGTFIKTAGVVGAGGQNGFAIYSDDGATEIFRFVLDSLWTTAGPVVVPLGGASIPIQATDKVYLAHMNVRGYSSLPDVLFYQGPAALGEGASKRFRYGPSAFPTAPYDPLAFGSSTGGYMVFMAAGE